MNNRPTITKDSFFRIWVNYLRSGILKQGKSMLKTEEEYYCCLGVACIVAQDLGMKVFDFEGMKRKHDNSFLPNDLAKFLNIDKAGAFKTTVSLERGGCEYRSLVEMNDAGISFKRISGVILKQRALNNFEKWNN